VNASVARAALPGSTIGVVTPGSPPETRAEVQRGIAWWESKGYRVKLMPGALEQDG
jgi:muramoyltetrapeptide carboxypeptidase LdcA involved in peptidoglycan recycling